MVITISTTTIVTIMLDDETQRADGSACAGSNACPAALPAAAPPNGMKKNGRAARFKPLKRVLALSMLDDPDDDEVDGFPPVDVDGVFPTAITFPSGSTISVFVDEGVNFLLGVKYPFSFSLPIVIC